MDVNYLWYQNHKHELYYTRLSKTKFIRPFFFVNPNTRSNKKYTSSSLGDVLIIIHTYAKEPLPPINKFFFHALRGARGSVVGWGTMLQTGRSQIRFPMSLHVFNWPNLSSRIMANGSKQSLTEMNTTNLPGGTGRPAREAENLTAICEPSV
jgi:hypothetical protein